MLFWQEATAFAPIAVRALITEVLWPEVRKLFLKLAYLILDLLFGFQQGVDFLGCSFVIFSRKGKRLTSAKS